MKYSQGDIVLVPYPFTDLSGIKKRPVLLISNSEASDLFIASKITSVIRNDNFSFHLEDKNCLPPMPKQSEVRLNEVFTIHKDIIIKKFSYLKHENFIMYIEKFITQFNKKK